MREIALHLLDIAENSVSAGARNIVISVNEDLAADRLTASVRDDGRGMTPEMAASVVDPFVTSRTTRKVGLGIPLLKAAAESCEGWLKIESKPGEGTQVETCFQHSHIDRMPLGDLASTFLHLLIAYPEIHWVFNYQIVPPGGGSPAGFCFDDREYKEALAGVSLTEPSILKFFRDLLEGEISAARDSLKATPAQALA